MKENHLFEGKSIIDKDGQCNNLCDADDLGDEDAAFDVSYIMNSRAPLTLRVNPLKITKYDVTVSLFSSSKNYKKNLNLDSKNANMRPLGSK